jgi:hypothetical protein
MPSLPVRVIQFQDVARMKRSAIPDSVDEGRSPDSGAARLHPGYFS